MSRFSKQLKGLTLIELLVVLGIIVILATISIVVIKPNTQRNRAKDGVLQNAISSVGQSVDSYYGLNGSYPTASQADQLQNYLQSGFVVDKSKTPVFISNTSIPTGIDSGDAAAVSGTMHYFANDFNSDGNLEVCVEAHSNETPAKFIAWAPGYAVKTLTNSCGGKTGYGELTGIIFP